MEIVLSFLLLYCYLFLYKQVVASQDSILEYALTTSEPALLYPYHGCD